MAVKPSERKLTEAELNAPDLDDDGELDPEHYPLPSADGVEDPYLAEVWDQAAALLAEAGNLPEDDDDEDDDPEDTE